MSSSLRHTRRTVLGAVLLAGAAIATAPAASAIPGESFVRTPTGSLTSMNSVNAFATTDSGQAWAVGSGWWTAEIARWDGTEWRYDQIPQFSGSLNGAVALDDTNVWAVGTRFDDANNATPVALHGTGSTWEEVGIPQVPEKFARLNDVAAGAANDVWAVGSAGIDAAQLPNPDSRPYVVHWDGTSWQDVPVPVPDGTRYAALSSVAVNGQEVWVAGYAYVRLDDGQERYRALVERWDGSQWTIVPTATEPGAPEGILPRANRVALGEAGQVWLAGQVDIAQVIQRWNGSSFERGPELPADLTPPTSRNGTFSADGTGRAWVASAKWDSGAGTNRPVFGYWDGQVWRDAPLEDASIAGTGSVVATSRSGLVTWAFVSTSTSGPVILRSPAS